MNVLLTKLADLAAGMVALKILERVPSPINYRRFTRPWQAVKGSKRIEICDARGRPLAFVPFVEGRRARSGSMISEEEARTLAMGIVRAINEQSGEEEHESRARP
jgi:hypothetical protein